MARLSTILEEHKTQLQEEMSELQEELQHRRGKDDLRMGNALKTISREIADWETEAQACDDSDESAQQSLMERARELRSKLVQMRSD